MIYNTTESATQGADTDTGANDRSTIQLITTVVYVLISVSGVVGNGLVLCVAILVPALRNVTYLFVANQSLVDFMSSVLLFVSFILPPIDLSGISETNHALATILCVVWNSRYLYWASLKISTGNLLCLTLERYVAVVHPYTYRERVNRKSASVLVLCIWIIGFLVEMPWAFSHFVADGLCQYRLRGQTARIVIACVVFLYTAVIPVVVMSFVYISILKKLREGAQRNILEPTSTTTTRNTDPSSFLQPPSDRNQHTNEVPARSTQDVSTPITQNNSRSRARRNVMATMFIVCVVYAVCITPNQIYFFLFILGANLDLSNVFYVVSVFMSATNICVNPLIYACKYRKFQKGVRALFCKTKVHVIVD
ncbi:Orexin receptor type 2 [Holothuria leucospilota]|uniref:Orexin receptor type 2 n=1 Tax=Holothuria leucospilota TaxID=206669 RepID=A0A9Q1CDQ8_HOLLE|nr:Orexin receptor type 2 [Holothuria leucospilota]